MKKTFENKSGNGCSGTIFAAAGLGLGTWALGNEKFNRSMADRGQIENMISTVEPDFKRMVPNMFPEDGTMVDGDGFRRFNKAHSDRKDWQWVIKLSNDLADVADNQWGTSTEEKVKYLTAMGRITKSDIGVSAREMFAMIRATQDIGARIRYKEEQWRMEAKELVTIVTEEIAKVDGLVQKSFLLWNVSPESGKQIGELLPEYTDLLGTYTFESGMVGSDVTDRLNELDGQIDGLLQGSGLNPQDIVRMTMTGSDVEKYTEEMDKVSQALKRAKIIN